MAIRKASKAPIPYDANDICYFIISDCLPLQLRNREMIRAAIANEDTIYCAWPGKTRTDLFIIDDPSLLRMAIRE